MCKGNYNSVLKGCGGQHGMRAYEVGIKDADWSMGTVFAPTAGKAKYKRLLDLKDAGWEPEFKVRIYLTTPLIKHTLRIGGPAV